MVPVYTPRPLPNLTSDYTVSDGMFDVIGRVFERILVMLRSVPVVPHRNGLFDPNTGLWNTPIVSAYDVILASFVVFTFVTVALRLSGGGLGTGLFGRGSDRLSNEIKR